MVAEEGRMGEVGIHRVLQGVRYTLYAIHTTPTTAGLSWITDMENYMISQHH